MSALRVPAHPSLYHITHLKNLPSISKDGYLWCSGEVERRGVAVTTIGMDKIKARRSSGRKLATSPGLAVGECVPFYFCARSVMLHMIHTKDYELAYRGGQEAVVHLQVDMWDVIAWAESKDLSWAFTTSNAGGGGFVDYDDVARLDRIDWEIVLNSTWNRWLNGRTFAQGKAARQAEFLVEIAVPRSFVERIGVFSEDVREQVLAVLAGAEHCPPVAVRRAWYH